MNNLIEKWAEYARTYPQMRLGQTLFNVMFELMPDVANAIRGTEKDPFHKDENIPAALVYAEKHF